MYKDKKVIAVVPSGRKKYLEILIPYLINQQNILDECHLWLNTTIKEDIDFMIKLENSFSNFIKIIECEALPDIHPVGRFLSLAPNDKNIIYIKIDDDICFIEKNAISNLVKFRVENPHYLLVYANTINNQIIDHLHQSICHKFADLPQIEYEMLGNLRYDGESVAKLHREFIAAIMDNKCHEFFFNHYELKNCEQTSINFIAYFANDIFEAYNAFIKTYPKIPVPDLRGWIPLQDEVALSTLYPLKIGKINAICGDAIVSHFSFYPLKECLEKTDLLPYYNAISKIENQNLFQTHKKYL